MKHPISTISNAAYLIAGLWLILDSSAWMQDYAGIMVMLLGIASGIYHWTDKYWAQKADIIAIFGAFNALMAWQLSTFAGFADYEVLLLLVSLALSGAIGATYRSWTHEQIGFLAIQNLMVLFVRSLGQFIPALLLYLVGLWIGQKAEHADKDSSKYDIPHAIWHLLTATAILLTGL
ncbi:hypothetical protein [Fodinibius sp.]|uniref:hypothetical protein n=1 Tax=Fodinibius sp. TaxID=1872440 RepID=UPI002ACDA625|nr:hypothetical protein [Fodinibius sp.]MDZ7658083.1 hypothetical protein [Fodinibius sp.]